MEIIVRGQHVDVPSKVESRAQRKLGRLEHYLPALADAVVEVDVTHEQTKDPESRYVVHALVSGHGIHLRAETRGAQLEAAIDQAASALTRQAGKEKDRRYKRGRARKAAERLQEEATPADEDDDEDAPELSKVAMIKRFPVKPMTTEEAVEQMELLGHQFFVFHDADVDQFALLYRRESGDFGLIIPELS